MPRLRVCLLACLCTPGCQGSLTTHPANEAERGGTYEGVKFYPTTLVREYSETTLVIKNDRIVASSLPNHTTPSCTPVKSARLIVAADFSKPLIVKFQPGLLEAYTFNPTLTDGMLTGLNSASTPDAGKTFNNIATGIGTLASLAPRVATEADKGRPEQGELACSDGNVVTDRVPELPK